MKVLSDTPPVRTKQSYEAKRLLALDDGRRLRLRLRRDSYDFQSHAIAELWIADRGWVAVLTRIPETLSDLPSYVQAQSTHAGGHEKVVAAVDALFDDMVAEALAVLGLVE